ncbi:hypothetical protein DNTS_030951 [Danionella cerebrum]|uniref:Charged multivesicular body protein 2Ba n=1 Tax=Danionella cerebrum TaxID=2873325 RepID=A0A553MXQ2_9TELE|nr:hypothetical protein DNTS_030951 [Danionella translucida]
MASLFKKKTVDDIIKEQSKELRGTQRQITRDRAALERQERQMILAKQLVQLRKQKNRTYAVSSKVTSMSTQTKVMNSQMKMAGAMSTTAKFSLLLAESTLSASSTLLLSGSHRLLPLADSLSPHPAHVAEIRHKITMQTVNKRMDPKKTLQTMQDFQKENLKMGMTEDMLNNTLDEIFEESGDEEESQDIVNQVLDEICIEISGKNHLIAADVLSLRPKPGKILPGSSPAKTKASSISDAEIERQLKALGMD